MFYENKTCGSFASFFATKATSHNSICLPQQQEGKYILFPLYQTIAEQAIGQDASRG